ncbi:MAG: hypothetical protein DCC69_11390 [Hyphomicrobiales bacterium]|nr:MAG: hypothetical protein DCC69_11390 [Hyphomicrobiales bacterium]
MATVYQARTPGGEEGYSRYREPDTTVPPRARPVLAAISVNGRPVPEADILAEAQHHPAATPGAALTAAARALVVRELLRQEVARLGIAAEPLADGAGRRETAEDAAIRVLLERELRVPEAGEAECRRFHANNRARFGGPQVAFEAVADDVAAWLSAASWSRAAAQYVAVLAGRAEIRGIDIGAAEGPLVR